MFDRLNRVFLKIKNQFGEISVSEIIFFLLLINLFFPFKFALLSTYSHISGIKSDFNIIFLHLSDILLITAYLTSLNLTKKSVKNIACISIFLVLFAYLTYFFSDIKIQPLHLYYLYISFLGFVAYETIQCFLKNWTDKSKKISYLILLTLISAQCLFANIQFIRQKSIGLKIIGETQINKTDIGIAKIDLEREKIIRPYGTTAHPNILALSTYTFWFILLYLHTKQTTNKIILYTGAITTWTLLLTFSRSIMLVWLGSTILTYILFWFHKKQKNIEKFFTYTILTFLVFLVLFSNIIFARYSFQDTSSNLRKRYKTYAQRFIHERPILGIGGGNFMFEMKQSEEKLNRQIDIQPVHNFYLLTWSEFGSLFLLALILFYMKPISQYFYLWKISLTKSNTDELILISYISGLVLLGLTDHYFATSRLGSFIFWASVSLLAFQKHKLKNRLNP